MLNQVYLDEMCCKEFGLDYSNQVDSVIIDPAKLLAFREDWDKHHKQTLNTYILMDKMLELKPVTHITVNAAGDTSYGWYWVQNPPQTRHMSTVDIDIELLRQQRDVMLDVMDLEGVTKDYARLLSGVVVMLDQMLDNVEGYGE